MSGEPEFSTINNPVNWLEFTYCPAYSGKNCSGKYIAHKTPSRTTVLPADQKTGKRKVGGFEFHYNGWKMPKTKQVYCRVGSTRDKFFPEDRASKLDSEHLTKEGLTKQRMRDKDVFFSKIGSPLFVSHLN